MKIYFYMQDFTPSKALQFGFSSVIWDQEQTEVCEPSIDSLSLSSCGFLTSSRWMGSKFRQQKQLVITTKRCHSFFPTTAIDGTITQECLQGTTFRC